MEHSFQVLLSVVEEEKKKEEEEDVERDDIKFHHLINFSHLQNILLTISNINPPPLPLCILTRHCITVNTLCAISSQVKAVVTYLIM